MQLKFSVFPALFFMNSAFAGASLPSVNISHSVSARAMYGDVPVTASKVEYSAKKQDVKNDTKSRISSLKSTSTDILVPHRPDENLWARNTSRAPELIAEKIVLPEETLAEPVPVKTIALRPAPKVEAPKKIVEKAVIDKEALAKAYEAGRISELQRIADKALAAKPVASKTRKLIVPMEDTSAAAIAADKSEKSYPMTEEDFAYKNSDDIPFTKLSPMQLKRAFKKTYVSENKHLSTYRALESFDTASNDSDDITESIQGFDSSHDLSEGSDIRPLEIKISFNGQDSALSRDNYMLLSEYAGIVVNNPKRAVQVSIPEQDTRSFDGRKLSAKRLAIIEQVLRDSGVPEQKIVPVLADRDDNSLVLRVISSDVYKSLTKNRGKKTTTEKSLAW
ncbi:MAG: hypothetical protein WC137_00655 [Alphaproteobacteria bacterium]